MSTLKFSKGFTLIELLVVIAIIGVLASVVLASLNNSRLKSRDARRVSDIKQLQTALQLYYDANTSTYPDALADLVTAEFMPAIPTDPTAQTAYPYEHVTSPEESYHLAAELEGAGHASLASDSDVDTALIIGSDDAEDCSGTVSARYCYDMIP